MQYSANMNICSFFKVSAVFGGCSSVALESTLHLTTGYDIPLPVYSAYILSPYDCIVEITVQDGDQQHMKATHYQVIYTLYSR